MEKHRRFVLYSCERPEARSARNSGIRAGARRQHAPADGQCQAETPCAALPRDRRNGYLSQGGGWIHRGASDGVGHSWSCIRGESPKRHSDLDSSTLDPSGRPVLPLAGNAEGLYKLSPIGESAGNMGCAGCPSGPYSDLAFNSLKNIRDYCRMRWLKPPEQRWFFLLCLESANASMSFSPDRRKSKKLTPLNRQVSQMLSSIRYS